ncbi:hypothetical protein C8R45DRAFT_923264 [Mycena sanguinolenta]|nr:hypothetical protein C8R45DRAFT_923264 [Mycena sanguinolenta]
MTKSSPPLFAGADGEVPVGKGEELVPVVDCEIGVPLDPPAGTADDRAEAEALEAEVGTEAGALEAEVEFPGHCPTCADDGTIKKLSETSTKLPGLFGSMLVQFPRI